MIGSKKICRTQFLKYSVLLYTFTMKILLISDKVIEHIYSATIADRFSDVDCIISCGDLPNYYLEFIVSMLNKPLFYVMGNHNNSSMYAEAGKVSGYPEGCINLNDRIIEFKNVILMGLEGSMKYSGGAFQYTEMQMAWKINRLKPRLLLNKLFKKNTLIFLSLMLLPIKYMMLRICATEVLNALINLWRNISRAFFCTGIYIFTETRRSGQQCRRCTKVINAYGYRILEI